MAGGGMNYIQIASVAAQALSGLGQMAAGNEGNKEAAKLAATHPDVPYVIPKEIGENARIAENQASQGLSDGAMQLYSNGINRNVAAGLDAIVKSGGSVNNIGELYGGITKGYASLAEVDENMRARKIAAALDQRQNVADEDEKQWLVNYYKPTQDARQAATALRAQSEKQKSGGMNTMLSALSNAGINDIYGNKPANKSDASEYSNTRGDLNAVRGDRTNYHPVVEENPGLQPGYNGITIGDVGREEGYGSDLIDYSSIYSDVG